MIPPQNLLTFALAALIIVAVPGPSVLFVVSRSLVLGRGGGLRTVAGNSAGLAAQVVLVAVGLGALLERSAVAFAAVKLVGAGYLVWLGISAVRSRRAGVTPTGSATEPVRTARVVREGFLVGLSNPKTLVFLAAILPQFAEPSVGAMPGQLLLLGAIFVIVAMIIDSCWAVAAGSARTWFARSPRRLAQLRGFGGLVMIGLGARLAFTGRAE